MLQHKEEDTQEALDPYILDSVIKKSSDVVLEFVPDVTFWMCDAAMAVCMCMDGYNNVQFCRKVKAKKIIFFKCQEGSLKGATDTTEVMEQCLRLWIT